MFIDIVKRSVNVWFIIFVKIALFTTTKMFRIEIFVPFATKGKREFGYWTHIASNPNGI